MTLVPVPASIAVCEGFLVLMVVYLVLTLPLSLLLRWYEKRITVPGY